MAFDPVDTWTMTLTPDGLLGATITFHFKVETHNATTNEIMGQLCDKDGKVPTVATEKIPLRNGKFRPSADAKIFRMNFEIDLGGLNIFLGGSATPRAEGSDKLKLAGTYFRLKAASASATAESLAEPGDTGTAGGQQTGT